MAKKRNHRRKLKPGRPTTWATLPDGVPKLVAGVWLIRTGNRVGVISERRVRESMS